MTLIPALPFIWAYSPPVPHKYDAASLFVSLSTSHTVSHSRVTEAKYLTCLTPSPILVCPS
jgi:hypothetical protein